MSSMISLIPCFLTTLIPKVNLLMASIHREWGETEERSISSRLVGGRFHEQKSLYLQSFPGWLSRWVDLSTSESEITQSCPTLCDPMDWNLPGLSVHGISRQEYWSGLPFPSPGDLPDPGIEPRSPTLQADTLPSESPDKFIART